MNIFNWLKKLIPHKGAQEISPKEMSEKLKAMESRIELRRKKLAK